MAKGEEHINNEGMVTACDADPSKPNYRGCPFDSNGGHLPANATAEERAEFEAKAEQVAQEAAQQNSAVGSAKSKKQNKDDWFAHADADNDTLKADRQSRIDAHKGDPFGQMFEKVHQNSIDALVERTEKLSPVPKWSFRTDEEAVGYADSANKEAMNYNAHLFESGEEEIRESGFVSREDLYNKTYAVIQNAKDIEDLKKNSGMKEERYDHNDFDDQVSWEEAHEPTLIDSRQADALENTRERENARYFSGYDERMTTWARIKGVQRPEQNDGSIEADARDSKLASLALQDVRTSLGAYSGNSDKSEEGKREYLKDAEEKMDLFLLTRKKLKVNGDVRDMMGVKQNG